MPKGYLEEAATSLVNTAPKVAVVLPVCNVAPYLEDCLNSVLAQTYSNFQVFAVDDNSSDSSPSILKKFIKEDNRISVSFLGQRKGVSNARNVALDLIERTEGFDYVAFVDGDDILEPYFLETLVKKSIETSSDITVCGFFNFYDGKEGIEKLVAPKKIDLSQEEFIEHVFGRGKWTKSIGGGGMVWKILFSSSVVKGCRFPNDVKIVEDEVFLVNIAVRSRKFAYVPLTLYGHRCRGDSLTCDRNITSERVRARMISLKVGKALPKPSQLVIVSALADALVKAFQYSDDFPEFQLAPYKQLVLKAAEKGLVRKKTLRKFLLFCNHPTLSKVFVISRRTLAKFKRLCFEKELL